MYYTCEKTLFIKGIPAKVVPDVVDLLPLDYVVVGAVVVIVALHTLSDGVNGVWDDPVVKLCCPHVKDSLLV